MTRAEKRREADLLIAFVRVRLAQGVVHTNRDGVKLTSVEQIVKCLVDEGEVRIA